MFFIIILMLILLFCIFMLFRNNWIYKISIQTNDLVHKLLSTKINNGSYSSSDAEAFYKMTWDYDKMLNYFWIWDLRKMVLDQKRFDELMEFQSKDSPSN